MNNSKEAQKFRNFFIQWNYQRETASKEQKNKVGVAFITKVLNLDEEVALNFIQGDPEAKDKVGSEQSGIPRNRDTSEFWEKVAEIFPDQYDEEDIEFLKEKGSVARVWDFIMRLDELFNEESPVLKSLSINAHAYK